MPKINIKYDPNDGIIAHWDFMLGLPKKTYYG